MSTQPRSFLTPEQYLDIERKAEFKSEYFNGEMFAMAGASLRHNFLNAALSGILYEQVRKSTCKLVHSDMRVYVPSTGLYTYPDVVVVCGEPELSDDHFDTLLNPTFLAEILSPSTEAYDRGRKFEHYRTVDSLREYLLVAQDRMSADLFTRQPDGHWLLKGATAPTDIIEVLSIACQVPIAQLYENVELQPPMANIP